LKYFITLFAAGILVFGIIGCNGKGESRSQRKIQKVILISIDTLRSDFLGTYNPEAKTSPNIDLFARDSIVFDNATAQAPSTAISHKSIFYSLYPAVHKTTKNTVPTETGRSPLEILKSKGFKTAAFVGGGQLARKFGFARGFDTYWEATATRRRGKDHDTLHEIENNAIEWLTENHKDNFFLFVHTYEVHCPYNPPPQFVEEFASWYTGPINPAGKCGDNFYNQQTLTNDDIQFIRDLYSGSVKFTDEFMGRFLQKIKDLGIYDETMIIFLSDHGESLSERGYIGHNQLYEVQLKIPFILRIPGYESDRIDAPVVSIDLMPTVFEALGLGRLFPFQGRNLLPVIGGTVKIEKERVLIAEQNTRMRVRKGDWSCVFSINEESNDELYNVAEDPEQTKDLAEENPEKVRELKQLYVRMLDSSQELSARFVLGDSSRPELDEATREQLEALGYVNQ
jgi:arylsulfatase A-like enzyme